MNTKNLITLGKLGAAHGLRGWMKVFSYTDDPESIFDYAPWRLSPASHESAIEKTVEDWKWHSNQLLVKLKGVESPEAASQLIGKLIIVQRDQLPKLEEKAFYWSDLIGLEVINKQGQSLGTIISLMETGSNDVLIVKNEKEHAIPYLPDKVVLKVDLDQKIMLVDWELLL